MTRARVWSDDDLTGLQDDQVALRLHDMRVAMRKLRRRQREAESQLRKAVKSSYAVMARQRARDRIEQCRKLTRNLIRLIGITANEHELRLTMKAKHKGDRERRRFFEAEVRLRSGQAWSGVRPVP